MELDGYASVGDIYGDEEEVDIYNFHLALEFYDAVVCEDFDSIGETLNDPYYWHEHMSETKDHIIYDGEASQSIIDNLDNMVNGTIITTKNRTFIEAAYAHGWTELAGWLLSELPESTRGRIMGKICHQKTKKKKRTSVNRRTPKET